MHYVSAYCDKLSLEKTKEVGIYFSSKDLF